MRANLPAETSWQSIASAWRGGSSRAAGMADTPDHLGRSLVDCLTPLLMLSISPQTPACTLLASAFACRRSPVPATTLRRQTSKDFGLQQGDVHLCAARRARTSEVTARSHPFRKSQWQRVPSIPWAIAVAVRWTTRSSRHPSRSMACRWRRSSATSASNIKVPGSVTSRRPPLCISRSGRSTSASASRATH